MLTCNSFANQIVYTRYRTIGFVYMKKRKFPNYPSTSNQVKIPFCFCDDGLANQCQCWWNVPLESLSKFARKKTNNVSLKLHAPTFVRFLCAYFEVFVEAARLVVFVRLIWLKLIQAVCVPNMVKTYSSRQQVWEEQRVGLIWDCFFTKYFCSKAFLIKVFFS